MIRLWNRFIKMTENRINKKIFFFSKLQNSPRAAELISITLRSLFLEVAFRLVQLNISERYMGALNSKCDT